jgi:hypothetical protein
LTRSIPGSTSIETAGAKVAFTQADVGTEAACLAFVNGAGEKCVFCAKAAVPLKRRDKGGTIVNVASVRSVVSGGGNLQYDTT